MAPRISQAISLLSHRNLSKCPAKFHTHFPVASSSRSTTPIIRLFATHTERPNTNSPPPSTEDLLRRLEAQSRLKGQTGSGFTGQESVGPFPLGVGASGRSRGWKSWRELGIGGKGKY